MTRLYLALVVFSIFGLAFCRWTGSDPGPIRPVAAGFTLIIGVAAAFRSMQASAGARAYWGLALLVLLGTGVELTGVRTGYPFGRYAYTDRWQPVVGVPGFGPFPLLLPLAWAMIVGASTLVVVRLGRGSWPQVAYAGLAAALATLIDLAMEPVMTGPLGYWHWNPPGPLSGPLSGPLPGGAPWLNPAGWFATSALGAAALLALGARTAWRPPDAAYVLGGHVGLLAAIAIFAR